MDQKLGRRLVLDELFDLTLYKKMRDRVSEDLRPTLDELIAVETKHYAFWQDFFHISAEKLDWSRRLKLWAVLMGVRFFGNTGAYLALEAIEIYGVRKYLEVWKRYEGTHLGEAARGVLEDEFRHEDEVVSQAIERRVHPERVRDIFLGFNDGMVEILGAVAGFLAAFESGSTVIAASVTVAVAGALSMAAGAYASTSSEREVERMQHVKETFLGRVEGDAEAGHPFASALTVGISYLIGAMVPVLPIAFGSHVLWIPVVAAVVVTVLVSGFISFLSGMDARKRIAMNMAIIAVAVGVTYSIGILARALWGINV